MPIAAMRRLRWRRPRACSPSAAQPPAHRPRPPPARPERGAADDPACRHLAHRLPGAHCYEFLATPQVFAQFADAEPGTFYLTDFLLRHYERLVVRSLGLDRHPELAAEYFRNYRKLVYLAQTEHPEAVERARQIADSLGFTFEYRYTGYGELGTRLRTLVTSQDTLAWQA